MSRGTILSTVTILATMLISVGHLAFAQKETADRPRPTAAVSPEWERLQQALKKAKPMVGNRNRDRMSVRSPFHRPERNATSHWFKALNA